MFFANKNLFSARKIIIGKCRMIQIKIIILSALVRYKRLRLFGHDHNDDFASCNKSIIRGV